MSAAPGPGQSLLEIYLPKKFLGHLIGKGGKNINAARGSTQCDIRVSDAPLPHTLGCETLLTITGSTAVVWTAAAHMASYLLQGMPGPDEVEGTITEHLAVPGTEVGHLIGKGGARINLMRTASNCKVQIEQPDPSTGVASVVLEGSGRAVLAAKMLVTAREHKGPQSGGSGGPAGAHAQQAAAAQAAVAAALSNPSGQGQHDPSGLLAAQHAAALHSQQLAAAQYHQQQQQASLFTGGAAGPSPDQLPMGMFGGY